MADRSVTSRGFTVYAEFTDSYGSRIRVQESSSAEGPRVWVFADHAEPPALPEKFARRLHGVDLDELAAFLEPSPHLDVEQARRLRDALDAFITEHGEDGDG
jgi:hypothetical protein